MHRKPPSEFEEFEEQADVFAAEFLMPYEDIHHNLRDINMQKLAALKQHWKVAMSALLKRESDLGKLTERQSRYYWEQMSKNGYRLTEPPELAPPVERPWA